MQSPFCNGNTYFCKTKAFFSAFFVVVVDFCASDFLRAKTSGTLIRCVEFIFLFIAMQRIAVFSTWIHSLIPVPQKVNEGPSRWPIYPSVFGTEIFCEFETRAPSCDM